MPCHLSWKPEPTPLRDTILRQVQNQVSGNRLTMNKSSQSKHSNEMTVDVIWVGKYEKSISVFEGHILVVIVCQVWLNKSECVFLVKTLIWHQEGKDVLYLSSASSEKFSIKSSLDCKTAYCMVNNRILKMPNIRQSNNVLVLFLQLFHGLK